MNVPNRMVIFPQTTQLSIPINIRKYPRNKAHLAYLTILDQDFQVLYTENLSLLTAEKELQISLPKANVPYYIRIGASGAEVKLAFPPNSQPAFDKFARLSRYPKRLYFYVPNDVGQLQISCPNKSKLTIFDSEGKEVAEGSRKNEVRNYPIANGQGGKVWSLHNISLNNRFLLLNLPSYFSLFPEAVIKK